MHAGRVARNSWRHPADMAGEEIAAFSLGVTSGPVVRVYTAARHTILAQRIPVALLQDRRGRNRAILLAALFPFSVAICF